MTYAKLQAAYRSGAAGRRRCCLARVGALAHVAGWIFVPWNLKLSSLLPLQWATVNWFLAMSGAQSRLAEGACRQVTDRFRLHFVVPFMLKQEAHLPRSSCKHAIAL